MCACSIRHVVGPVMGRNRMRQVVVLTTYLDDSGTDKRSPVVTMAGYVGEYEIWKDFESDTDAIFGRYGLERFHAKKFHGTKPPFKGWKRKKKEAFVSDWFDKAEGRIPFGFSISARKQTYSLRGIETGLAQNTSAYGFCFNIIIDRLLCDPELAEHIQDDGVSFVIESGNKNNGDIERIFHAVKRHHKLERQLRSISFADKDDFRALQLADFLAFYSRRHAEICEKENRAVHLDGFLHDAARRIPCLSLLDK